jgi:hypothetical protein
LRRRAQLRLLRSLQTARSNVAVLCVAAIAAASLAGSMYHDLHETPEAAAAERQMHAEYAALAPMPGATSTSAPRSYFKSGRVLLTEYFASDASWSMVRRFYDAEFSGHGWASCGEKVISNRGDVRTRYFKGAYAAEVQYNPETRDYGIDMSWHFRSACSDP